MIAILRHLAACRVLLVAALLFAPVGAAAAPSHITPELVVERAVAPGETAWLAVVMRPAPGWHGYWQNPGDAGLGLRLEWSPAEGFGAPRYPVPETLLIAGLMNHVYNRDYALLVPYRVPASARPGSTLPLHARAQWLACTREVCVPERGELSGMVRVATAAGPADPRIDAWRAALPAPLGAEAKFALAGAELRLAIPLPATVKLDQPHLFVASEQVADYAGAQHFERRGDSLLVTLPRAKFNPASPGRVTAVLRLNGAGDGVAIEAAPGPVPAAGGAPSATAYALLVLAALAGGLLLNVMPCVFPILSLKAMALARAGESEAMARAEGLAYSAGVVLACLGLGALMLALRAAGQEVGWAFQLQEPLVVAALLALAMALTANFLGLFEFAVPGFATHPARGAFATGLLAAFAATPCTGPFMAGAMGAALLLPTLPALVLFAALGLGIALPYLAVAYVPALRRRLPRPGAWMVWFRRAMAVPMALTVLALAWLASRLGGQGFAALAVALGLAALAVLAWLGREQRRGLGRGTMAGAALAALALAGWLALPPTVKPPAAEADALLPSQPFSEAALASARAAGHPVFAWFTADWCLTCKVNEQVAIARPETRDAFARAGVVVLKGDWTRRDPAITRYLSAQGAAGVPLYVWYPPHGGAPQVLPQVLTPASLSDLASHAR
ncbi:MAG: thioredoxin family protein [Proteobacteria bacterium]|nr:thioredoxin family protein [Pseudomonadota bacterium]